jgi:hypothetical protein
MHGFYTYYEFQVGPYYNRHRGAKGKARNEVQGTNLTSSSMQHSRESDTRFSPSGIFYKSASLGPLSIPLGTFPIFSKIRGNIRELMFISGVNNTSEKREKF